MVPSLTFPALCALAAQNYVLAYAHVVYKAFLYKKAHGRKKLIVYQHPNPMLTNKAPAPTAPATATVPSTAYSQAQEQLFHELPSSPNPLTVQRRSLQVCPPFAY